MHDLSSLRLSNRRHNYTNYIGASWVNCESGVSDRRLLGETTQNVPSRARTAPLRVYSLSPFLQPSNHLLLSSSLQIH
jgi:hypothetical protein